MPKPTAIGESEPLGQAFRKGPSPWKPVVDTNDIKHLGKLGEEAGELVNAICRTLIQGLDGVNPTNGESNREWLENEMADVLGMIAHNIKHFKLNEDRIMARMEAKMAYIKPWFEMP